MNQKCHTFGHDQRKIQFVCVQPYQILWGCSICFEQNKNQYDFKPITDVLEILEQIMKEVKNPNFNKQIEESKNLFEEILNSTQQNFLQFIHFLQESFSSQYHELLRFANFFKEFQPNQLDSDNLEIIKYLYIVVNQKASPQTIFEVQTSFKTERLSNINKQIQEQMKEVYEQKFEQILQNLEFKYKLPKEFSEQIMKLQIPQEYDITDNPNIKYCFDQKQGDDICYNGQTCGGLFQGTGILEVEDQKIFYYGAFIQGHFCYGIKCKINQNELFQGTFQFNKQYDYQIAKNGILIKADLERYDGQFENELQEGQGISHFKNKDFYCGGWKKGFYEGQGYLFSEEYGHIEGEFKNGMLNGKAIFKNDKIKDNLRDGHGVLEDYLSKTKYIGEFKLGKKEGQGILKISDEKQIEGNFMNDQPSGKCKQKIKLTIVENLKKQVTETIEEGEYKNGQKTGLFTSVTTNNDKVIKKIKYYEDDNLIYEENDS